MSEESAFSLSEEECERVCRDCAHAFCVPELGFYETCDWLEIYFDRFCVALTGRGSKGQWQRLLCFACHKLNDLRDKGIKSLQGKVFSPEEALVHLDLCSCFLEDKSE